MQTTTTEIDFTAWTRKIDAPLPEETKTLIIEQMKIKHRKRYGQVNGRYRKTYNCDDLWSDLQFILNHLHV